MINTGVHGAHCCKEHGCKYNDPECPVVKGKVKQRYPCEDCGKPHLHQCPKCRSDEIMVRWHTGGYSQGGAKCCGKHDASNAPGEHMHYYCETCLFDWTEDI